MEVENSPTAAESSAAGAAGGAEDQGQGFWASAWGKALKFAGLKLFYGMEFIGEIVADLLGLNTSEYQYVIDTIDDAEERKRLQAMIKQRHREDEGRREQAAKEQADRDADEKEAASNTNAV